VLRERARTKFAMGFLDFLPFRRAKRPSPEDADLFDDEFQRKLDYLALVSKRIYAGRMRAERRTKKSGSGIEFADHRDYQPGDDFRYLDWSVYQRFDRLLVRLFEEEEDLAIYFVLDTSSSMGFGSGDKLRYAKRICAALAYVGLANLDRVTLVTTTSEVLSRMPETRGKGRIFRVFRFLREVSASGVTDLEASLRAFVAQHKKRGIAVLVSDLYEPHGFEQAINVLRYNKFDPYVIHVVDPQELRIRLEGDVLLYDCETGEEVEVTATEKDLARFESAAREYVESIDKFCRTKQVPYVRADITVPFEELVLRVLRRGGLVR
jgi:uncharacterized protein (DUF58 family)